MGDMRDFHTRLNEALNQINGLKISANIFEKWSDPRANDLKSDSWLWYELMAIVNHDKELFDMLGSMRESGTVLERQNTLYKMVPFIDHNGRLGYENEDEFKKMTLHFEKKRETLTAALMQLHQKCGSR